MPPKPPNPQGTLFGESGTYLGGDEQEDVTQVGREEEKTQAHITPKSLVSLEPLPPVPAFDYDEKTLKRQGVPPLPAPSSHDWDDKTLKRQGPPAAAPELPPEVPTRQIDQTGFQQLAASVRDVLPELAEGAEDRTVVHPLPGGPEPMADLPELGPEAPTGVLDESALGRIVDQHAKEVPADQGLEAEPPPELLESPPEDKTTMQPTPPGPGLAQRARKLWTQARPKLDAAWKWARQRPALSIGLAAAGVAVLVAAAWAMSGESAAELAARTILLRPGNDGTVARVVVEADERVRKGQLLLVVKADQPRMDSPELASLEERLQVAQNALKHAKSGADIKKAAAEVARRKAEVSSAKRAEAAVAAKVRKKKATAEQLALATAKVHGAEERLAKATARQGEVETKSQSVVAQAQDDAEAAQAQLDVARAKAAMVEVRSPVDGVVVTPDPGEILGKKVRGDAPVLSVRADEDSDPVRRPR